MLMCGCDGVDYYVDLLDPLVISVGTEFCCECGRLIPQGEEHYHVRQHGYDEDGGEGCEKGQRRACEACGDLAISFLSLGYCWSYGELRADIKEMNSY